MKINKKKNNYERPSIPLLEAELKRERHRNQYFKVLRSTIYTLITVAAVAILVATLWLPVLQIYGSSMTPTLHDGDIVVSLKSSDFKPGEIVAFYYNNKVLIKRVIARAGDWVDIKKDGTVIVNGETLDEPYIEGKDFGDTDIELPYQVPEARIFVLGDHRNVSVDSRNTMMGSIAQEQIVGKLIFRFWPLNVFGSLKS
ncbi:signal peptidase I [Dehalobacterium formicoaceticum]|uniref:Signal peptidase I n=1 Tax=Dehalobacterium formicoaceticum TaxID=51515 RepID=A0ABT1Y2H2_9FIRM|nr:signal peptidase I [Dehalobacterium formicoaceticum]MCR6545068.1 signal peptidase I [Dehalobacterium formicoaceticum]